MRQRTPTSVTRQLMELQNMGVPALQAKFEELYGFPTTQKRVVTLRKRIAFRIQELHYGGLSSAEKEVLNEATPYWFNNDDEVAKTLPVMSANEWRCDFFPQRHWLWGWNGLAASWLYKKLVFQDGKVVRQEKGALPYKTYGVGGQTPFPQFPKNFHQVNENIFRSGQPDDDEFKSLCTFNGIRSVLNLRENNSDKGEIESVNAKQTEKIRLYEIPLDTGSISENDLYKILYVIKDAPKPLLIHCWHGSDRTGCAVAAYRIVFEKWSVEDAIAELMKPEYGHHKHIYTNIPELLLKADWQKIKTDLDLP